MRFRAPASVLLRRAQLILMLVTLVPTIGLIALGIVLLAVGSGSVALVAGVLVLAFCTTSLTGYILGSIFVSRGESLTRMQAEFLSAVSHEIRTPLTSLQLFVETLRDDRVTDPAERAKCLAVIHRELRRLDGLVGKLIELSRAETGRAVYERRPVVVAEVLDEALAAFRAATLGTRVEVQIDAEPELVVLGDRAALVQVVGNLLTNAWKHGAGSAAGPGGRIRLQAAALGRRQVVLAVEDNGPGVAPEDQERVFENFERGRAAIDRGTVGSGLGLAIVRAIVRAHGGRIDVGPAPGGGARFQVQLARCPAASVAGSPANAAVSPVEAA